jgi:hypothetical protein
MPIFNTPKNLFIAILRSVIVGWAALMVSYTACFIYVACQPGFDPEIGPTGTFIFFFLYYSFGYLVFYLILGLPAYFLLRHYFRHALLWQRALLGALLSALSVTAYNAKVGDPFVLRELLANLPFAAISGCAAFAVLPFSSRYEA